MIYAVVGSGGKTTLVHELAEKYRKQGKKVFVTTSTHMFIEPDTLLTENAEEILCHLKENGYVMAGIPEKEKIRSLPFSVYKEVSAHADVTIVEADGSKHMPLKFPNKNEPVIYENTDEILVVCGLQALGKRAKEVSHRLNLVLECLKISEDTVITPEHIQKLVQKGYVEKLRREYPGMCIRICPAHDSFEYQKKVAEYLEKGWDVSELGEEEMKVCLHKKLF